MTKNSANSDDDLDLFKQTFADVAPLKQDKIPPQSLSSKQKSVTARKKAAANAESRRASASFEFSDQYEAHFAPGQTMKYVAEQGSSAEVKRLRKGDYPPDLILDLHGLRRDQAKLEIGALIEAAKKQHAYCVCIVHGIGGHILKLAVPSWLVQHPDVLGFHQAPLEWGGDGALLVLINQGAESPWVQKR